LAESSSHEDKRSLRGAFITFEGIDGCGKTTQAKLLAERLRAVGHSVVETREPGGTQIGRELRKILLATRHQVFDDDDNGGSDADSAPRKSRFRGMAPSSQLLLFLADRIQHLEEVIRPAMKRGETVISDRFHDATVAYQSYGRGLDLKFLQDLINSEINTTTPDLTILLDIDVETAWERSRTGGSPYRQLVLLKVEEPSIAAQQSSGKSRAKIDPDSRELMKFFGRVRKGYSELQRIEPNRIIQIQGDRAIETIADDIWNLVRSRHVL